jgi:1,4-dihydroxy-2-naphthoate octaprenyltransferase
VTEPIAPAIAEPPVSGMPEPQVPAMPERGAPIQAGQRGAAPGSAARPSGLRIWLMAARPATLPAAVSGVVVGLGAARGSGYPVRFDTALGCIAVALLLQVVANLANDLSDFRKGADTPDRSGPLRVAAAGLVTERQLEVAIGITIVAAGLVGLWLATVGGTVLLALGALAIVAALAYTGGPWPYGYRALGEVFVFIFFGLVAVVGTAYLQAARLEPVFWAAAVPVGCLVTAILVVNNLRDIPTDRAAGKRTLAVVLGARATQVEFGLQLLVAAMMPVALLAAGWGVWVMLPLLATPLAVPLLRTVRDFTAPRELNLVLKGTARLALAYSLLFAIGLGAS